MDPPQRVGAVTVRLAHVAAVFMIAATVRAETAPERSFPQNPAQVQAVLKNLPGGTAGSLPLLDGFVATSVAGLDQYQRPYYKCTVTVVPVASGGSRVRVSAKITAWHSAGSKPGYDVLPSNGRVESDLLDRLEQALSSSVNVNTAPQDPTARAMARKTKDKDQPTIDAPSLQFPRKFEPKMPAPNAAPGDPALQREADSLSEILRNQSHPANLVAVKKDQTPVLQSPALDAKVLFLASAQDEFEIIEQNPDWIHVRISGLSRGWVRRSGVELLDGSESLPGDAKQAVTPSSNPAETDKSTSVFSIGSEETGDFPGDWASLKGKSVKIVSVQSAKSGVTSGEDKLKFAEQMFQRQNASGGSEGLVVVFDTEDGGMIAATASAIDQYKRGRLSEAAFWKQCYVDPPEVLGSAR